MHLPGDAKRMALRGSLDDKLRYLDDWLRSMAEMRLAVIQREKSCSREEAIAHYRRECDRHHERKVEQWRRSLDRTDAE